MERYIARCLMIMAFFAAAPQLPRARSFILGSHDFVAGPFERWWTVGCYAVVALAGVCVVIALILRAHMMRAEKALTSKLYAFRPSGPSTLFDPREVPADKLRDREARVTREELDQLTTKH